MLILAIFLIGLSIGFCVGKICEYRYGITSLEDKKFYEEKQWLPAFKENQ